MTELPEPVLPAGEVDYVMRSAKSEVLVELLLHVVNELEALHPGRKFTPDGHLVGSLGEAAAEAIFDIVLTRASTTGHDAVERGGRRRPVEIKATFGAHRIAVRRSTHLLDDAALVVLRLSKEPGARHEVVYDGPAAAVLPDEVVYASNGQAQISIGSLRAMNARVDPGDRVARRGRSGRQGSILG